MGFPEHPNTIIIKSDNYNFIKNITEYHIWQYYEALKSKIVPFLKGSNLFVLMKADNKELYIRHPFKGPSNFIRINSPKDFEEYNTGRVTEFHITSPRSVDYFVLDMDPGKDVGWNEIKRSTLLLYDFLNSTGNLKEIKIYFTGSRSFHIWCFLKKPKGIDSIRTEWKKILLDKFKGHKTLIVDKKQEGKDQINIDFAPVKINGGHIAPYSIRLSTGLVCIEIDPKDLLKFKKSDAKFDIVYKDITKKGFPWTRKESFLNIIADYLTQPLVSIPPYRGNLLEYLEEKNTSKEAHYESDKLISGYKGEFVIHDHKASHHHWDLRLTFPVDSLKDALKQYYSLNNEDKEGSDEEGVILRSWAIPKHTLPMGDTKILALETEPHPMSTLKFKGTIPEGEYGAGEMNIYDKGTFEFLSAIYDKSYRIKFKGDKLNGVYTLVKLGKSKNFLFLKSKND